MSNKNFRVKNGLEIGNSISITDAGVVLGLDTDNLAEGTTNVYFTDDRVLTKINATAIDALSNVDNTSTALAAGQQFYYNGTNWVNSTNVDSANVNRFLRTNTGTASNAVLAVSRNRTDAARAVDGGPWLGFEYVGTDNTQATAPQSAIRSRYQTSGNHQIQFVQLPGNYNTPTVAGQIQRGNHILNTTGGVAAFLVTDTFARLGGDSVNITNSANTTTYAAFAAATAVITASSTITLNGNAVTLKNSAGTVTNASFSDQGAAIYGSDLTTVYRTRTGTPGVAENRPSMNIQLSRSDQAVPNDSDGTSFRARVAGSSGVAYTIADIGSTYKTGGDVVFNVNLANGDQTGAAFSSLNTFSNTITRTVIKAGFASGTPGASTASDVAVFTPTNNSFRADALTLTDYASVPLASGKITYARQYINAYSTVDQPNPVANAENLMIFGTTDISNGISIVTNGTALTRITFANAGIYNLQFSAQLSQTSGGSANVFVWLKKNGANVANTAGDTQVAGNGDKIMAAWNYVFSAAAGDYYELAWASTATSAILDAIAAAGAVPGIPSVILTVVPVGA